MDACPNCDNLVAATNSTLSYCVTCNDYVLPYFKKAEKTKNYKERNTSKFSSLPSAKQNMKPVGKKMSKRLATYRAAPSDQQGTEPVCAKCGATQNLTKHHPYGRSGTTEDGRDAITVWIWLCTSFGNRCHDVVHENPDQALKDGWLQPEYRNLNTENYERKKPWL